MIDLKFGDPVLLREQLKNFHTLSEFSLGYRMDDECEKSIIKWVKSYYKRNFNLEYKHVILTHGANGGLHMLINVLKSSKDLFVINDLAFGWYEKLLKMENVIYYKSPKLSEEEPFFNAIYIMDNPNNPWGELNINLSLPSSGVIWDSVYASPIFVQGPLRAPPHTMMVGSLSKMFGLSGLRIGWVGVNDDFLADKLKQTALTAYCGLSTPSLEIADNLLRDIDLKHFEYLSKMALDDSRDKFNKLRNIFGLDAPNNGMFYMGNLDSSNQKLLEKAEVNGLKLTTIDGQDYIRFNMADSSLNTKNAIKAILKADSI
jgi:aspartate/methionine/tyrosine aminotransferase